MDKSNNSNNMDVKKSSNTQSLVKYIGRSPEAIEPETDMAVSRADDASKRVDESQPGGTPKYRILPKLLTAKHSQKETNDYGRTGFHVRVSPVATSTPKDKVNGRVVTSQEKRAESRAKRRQYLAGECVSPSSNRSVTFPSSPETKKIDSAQKQKKKETRPCSSPPSRRNGSPLSRPYSSPPVRPSGSPSTRLNSSPPVRPSGSPSSRPNSSHSVRPSDSPVSRPTGSPPPRPISANSSPRVSGITDRTTNKVVGKGRTTNAPTTKDITTNRTGPEISKTNTSDIKHRTVNVSASNDRTVNTPGVNDITVNTSDVKDTTENTPDTKNEQDTTAMNTSDINDIPTNTTNTKANNEYAGINGNTKQMSSPQMKRASPPTSPNRTSSNTCDSPQTLTGLACTTHASVVQMSALPYAGYRMHDKTNTYFDTKATHGTGESASNITTGHRPLVGRVTPITKTCVWESSTSQSQDRNESYARIEIDKENVSIATGDTVASSHLLHDAINNSPLARTVSHNDALSKSTTSAMDADWTGSVPEQLGVGKIHLNYTCPDGHRIDVHNDNHSGHQWTGTKVVRSQSDVFSCSQTCRPTINDCIKLTREGRSNRLGERCRPQLPPPPPPARASLSADDIDTSRLIVLSTRRSFTFSDRHSNLRSSFMQPQPKSPPSDPVQNELECIDVKTEVTKSGDTGIYSLPQPQCYSEDTMKAIKQITDKYDTLQRRRLQAMSFRETGRRKPSDRSLGSTVSAAESDPVIADRSASTDAVDGNTDDAFDADEEVTLTAGITQRDIARLELFYGSRDTEIVICRCLADVLFSEKSTGNSKVSPAGWRHAHTGVPVFVLNTGRGTRKRDLRVVLAERETGFGLWHDKITYLSNYMSHEGATAFHTMQHSSRPIGDLVGLRFYDAAAAETFHARFLELTSDPTDELWRVGSSGHRKSSAKKRWRLGGRNVVSSAKPTTKRDISQPCNFAHVTNVKQLEPGLMSSLADMIARTVARRVVGRSPSSRPSSYSSIASST